mgnify:CR=1 FL=1
MIDNGTAIYDFLCMNDLRYSQMFTTNVIAKKNSKTIYDQETECQIAENHQYSQIEIRILWNTTDEVWRNLGLHGVYNTNFQEFTLQGETLVVHAKQITIQIKSLHGGK